MAQGPRHLADSFVSVGLRKTAQTLTAAEKTQVQSNLALDTALALKADLISPALITPYINGVQQITNNVRQLITEVYTIGGGALHLANLTAVTFPAAALILRAILDVTTVSTGVATIDIGYTAVSATTASDTLLDGVDVNTGIAVFDSMDFALDTGTNAHAQKAASAKWITIHENADTTGLVAKLYVQYILI